MKDASKINVLIACEESQRVCTAFRKLGFNAYSNDVQKCSGGHPEWHILDSALSVVNGGGMPLQSGEWIDIPHWNCIIAHPPCTALSNANASGHSLRATPENRIQGFTFERIRGMEFFMYMVCANSEHIAVENPVGIMNTAYRKPDQIIDPYMFASSKEDKANYVKKRTCLWLKNLPLLKTNDLSAPNNLLKYGKKEGSEKTRSWAESLVRDPKERSKTFPGIAKAMAEQWGEYLLNS